MSGFLVPKAGLEPARIAAHASETCMSTNFITSASPHSFAVRKDGKYPIVLQIIFERNVLLFS